MTHVQFRWHKWNSVSLTGKLLTSLVGLLIAVNLYNHVEGKSRYCELRIESTY